MRAILVALLLAFCGCAKQEPCPDNSAEIEAAERRGIMMAVDDLIKRD